MEVKDPETGKLKTITGLVLHAVELDGRPVDMPYSTISANHKSALKALIPTNQLFSRVIIITKVPAGRATEYKIQVI